MGDENTRELNEGVPEALLRYFMFTYHDQDCMYGTDCDDRESHALESQVPEAIDAANASWILLQKVEEDARQRTIETVIAEIMKSKAGEVK